MFKNHVRTLSVALLSAALVLGCSDSSSPDNTLSDDEVSRISDQVVDLTIAALNSPTATASTVSSSNGAAPLSAIALAPVPMNIQYSSTHSCPAGGRAGANGSITGSIDSETGDGVLWLQILFTYTDCTFSVGTRDVTVNGNPSLTLTGNFSYLGGEPATQQTLSLSGALSTTFIQFCGINLTFNVATAGNGSTTVSGTVCGRQVSL
jgi:hypothetical protein